jgi:hypothetical protein
MGAVSACSTFLSTALLCALVLATACGSPAGTGAGGAGGTTDTSTGGTGDAGTDAGVITVSCDATFTMSGTTAHTCVLFTGAATAITALQAEPSCTGEGGTVGLSCVTTGTLGSCAGSSMGVTTVIYYYPGETAADDQSYCTSIDGTWTPS